MNGLPHYFLIGLIISYVYWLLIGVQVAEIGNGYIEIVGAYLGWLTSDKAQTKEMALVVITLVFSLLAVMVLIPARLSEIIGLLTFISVGWLGSLSTTRGDF